MKTIRTLEASRGVKGFAMLALLASISLPGALHGANYTYTWTWTGNGDGITWSDGGNWTCSPSGAAYEYPSTVEDFVKFNSKVGGGLVVTSRLDEAVTIYGILQSGSDPLLLTTTNDSQLTFSIHSGGDVESMYDGVCVDQGSTLYLDVPIVMDRRFDKWGGGTVYWQRSFVNGVNTSSARYNFIGGAGTNFLVGNFSLTGGSKMDSNFGFGADVGKWTYLYVQDNASLECYRLKLGTSRSAPNILFRQDGDGTRVVASDFLGIGNFTDGNHNDWSTSVYHMVRGTLSASYMNLAPGRPGRYVQDGGTATVSYVSCGAEVRSYGSFELNGGRFVDTSGDSSADMFCSISSPRFDVSLTGGTLAFTGEPVIRRRLRLSGSPSIEMASGKAVQFRAAPDIAAGTSLTKTGPGTMRIMTDFPAVGSLTVEEGAVYLGYSNASQRYGVYGAYDDYTPWHVKIKNGGLLGWHEATTSITSYFYQPMDLDIDDGGCFSFYSHRTAAFAHSLTANGVKVARGVYRATKTGHIRCSGTENIAHMIVPYTWTGGGDGVSWTDTANWEDGAVPPNVSASDFNVPYADLSRATNITFTSNITIGGILYSPNGANKRLVISSDTATLKLAPPNYQISCQIRPDATLEFDCKVARYKTCGLVGNGTYVFRRNIPGAFLKKTGFDNDFMLSLVVDGTLILRGVKECIPESSNHTTALGFHSNQSGSESTIVFEGEDTDFALNYLFFSRGGYTGMNRYIQRDGAKLTVTNFCVNTHRTEQEPKRYYLQGGTLTCVEGLFLNTNLSSTVSSCNRVPGGSFEMTGGTLTTPQIGSECLQNWCYLNGGDAYVGAGGISRTCCTNGYGGMDKQYQSQSAYNLKTGEILYNTTPSLQLGGVNLHASADFSVTLDTAFSGVGGATTIDTAGHDITFEGCVLAGTGGWRKIGEGTLYLNGTNSFTGAMSVEAGTVVVGAEAVNESAPARLELASASSLSLPAGAAWTVETLIVGGVRKAAGESVTVGEGTVTVVQPAALAAGRWIGPAAGGDWFAPANWSDGVVPNAERVTVDLVNTSLADGAQLSIGSDLILGGMSVEMPGTVTLSAAGDVRLVLTNATLNVSPETTLVIDIPVVVGKSPSTVSGGKTVIQTKPLVLTGGGKVVFARDVVNQDGTFNLNGYHHLKTAVGMQVEFRGLLWGVMLQASSSQWQTDCTELTAADGSMINLAATPITSGFVKLTQSGGTVTFTNSVILVEKENTRYDHVLNSGELLLPNGNTLDGGFGNCAKLELNGGTVKTSGYGISFGYGLPTWLGGAVAFAQSDAETDSTFACPFQGEGSVTQQGPGRITFTGGMPNAGAFAVQGGTLALKCLAAPTNLVVGAGVLAIDEVAAAGMSSGAASLHITRKSTLELDFDGELVVRELFLNGVHRSAGLYDDGTLYDTTIAPNIRGMGVLRVLEGFGPGLQLFVR